jgi:VWFA-related protein
MTLRPFAHALLLLPGAALCAQTTGTNAATEPGQFTISAKTQLVVETVVVKDKSGKFIPGLNAKDFALTEDGTPQTIRFVEHEQLPTETNTLPALTADEQQITVYKRLARTAIASEAGGSGGASKYQGHRLLVLYFDMTTMSPEDQQRALTAAEKFVRTQLTAADLVSIMRYSGGSVDVLQDFSADRNHLLSILETLIVGEGQGLSGAVDDASSADTGAAFGQDDSEFNIFNTDRQLSALQTAARMLAGMNEKKALIYFASGLRLNGIDNQAQLHATVDAAVRAGVTFWPIDARGLVASAPLGDATQGSAGNQGMYSGAAAQATTDGFQKSQDTLYALAADTGGKALLDNNDLTRGITQAQHAIVDYYIIGYAPSNTAPNGRFRKIKITLTPERDASLDYRQGYYATKEFARFNETDKERQLEDALMLEDPVTDLTIAMEINWFQLNRAEYYVPIMVKIPGRELALAKKMGAERTVIDFVCEVKDELGGITVSNIRDSVNIKLSDSAAATLAHQPIEYDAGFTLTPGKYSIKFLARNNETGRIGTYQTSFVVPNLNKEAKAVPISTVVLSSQRIDNKDALYNVQHGKEASKNDAANPLVSPEGKLIPSVTRVFSTDRELYIYLQAYTREAAQLTNTPVPTASPAVNATSLPVTPEPAPASQDGPLVAFVSFYKDGQQVYEATPIAVTPRTDTRLGVVPLSFKVSLGSLAAGTYICQVSVLDASHHRVAFRRYPILLTR